MKKTFLLTAFLFLLIALKAQQPQVKKEKEVARPPVQTGQTIQKPIGSRHDTAGKMESATRNAEIVRRLLRKKPAEKPRQKQAADTSKQVKKAGNGN